MISHPFKKGTQKTNKKKFNYYLYDRLPKIGITIVIGIGKVEIQKTHLYNQKDEKFFLKNATIRFKLSFFIENHINII